MKKCPHCNKPLLSLTAENVLNFVKRKGTVRSDDVVRELGMSITNSNNYLRDLWVMGFLNRDAQLKGHGYGFNYKIIGANLK